MKYLITGLLVATALVPAAASAQTRELQRDRQDIREERRELNRAYRYGDRDDIRDERDDLRDARREYREDVRDYRHDRREDWRDYRRDNPRAYSRGNWRAPFGYNRFGVGSRVAPHYYGQRYWIADPYRYRLPRAYPGTRWVRHYDDVLLIDLRSGRVRQVVRGFYW
jgi:Ni/Co efflux regulator RcnB